MVDGAFSSAEFGGNLFSTPKKIVSAVDGTTQI
jgi:hypothetical protein